MPRRVKIDRAPILADLAITRDISETARRLGLHYNTVLQINRLRRGLCMRCGHRPHQPALTTCGPCAKWERERTNKKRAKARKHGRCSMCPRPLRKGSTLYCETHYHQTFERQRAHRMSGKYGPHALSVLKAANGKCQICSKDKSEQRLHLHHIDGDHANHSPDNFVIICWGCHYAVHALLASKNRKALIEWFSNTYPMHPLR